MWLRALRGRNLSAPAATILRAEICPTTGREVPSPPLETHFSDAPASQHFECSPIGTWSDVRTAKSAAAAQVPACRLFNTVESYHEDPNVISGAKPEHFVSNMGVRALTVCGAVARGMPSRTAD